MYLKYIKYKIHLYLTPTLHGNRNLRMVNQPHPWLWEFGIPTRGNPMGIPTEILRELGGNGN